MSVHLAMTSRTIAKPLNLHLAKDADPELRDQRYFDLVEQTRETLDEVQGSGVDLIVWPEPGDAASGKDRQIEKAVEALLADVKEWKARPQPKLQKASERK